VSMAVAPVVPMLFAQTRAQVLNYIRIPAFSLTSLALPLVFYTFFGLPNAGKHFPDGTSVGLYLMCSLGAYAVSSVMVFSFGIGVANARGLKLDLLQRATPLPPAVAILANVINAVIFALVAIAVLMLYVVVFGGVRFPVETGLLLALAFFLPLFEAPKNLLWLAYLATWLVNRARARDFGGRWDGWDSLFAAWIASAFAAAAFAGLPHHEEWRSTGDVVRYVSILWTVRRARYSDRELKWVLGMLVASTIVGLAYGYWRLLSGVGKSGTLQLHSVGHVNHTAIYIAIILGVTASWLFARWRAWRPGARAAAVAINLLVVVSLFYTASRGAIGIGLLLLLGLAIAWWPRWRAPVAAAGAAVVLLVGVALLGQVDVVRKHQQDTANENVLAFRDGVWRMGLEGWRRFPAFGVGLDNFQFITLEAVKAWRAERG